MESSRHLKYGDVRRLLLFDAAFFRTADMREAPEVVRELPPN